MEIQNCINEFIAKINNCSKILEDFSMDIQNRENKILESIEFAEQNILKQNLNIPNEENYLKNLCMEKKRQVLYKIDEWISLIRTNVQGKEFMNKFEKSLVIIVFGNVNTGKSTFGNFIAGVPFRNNSYLYTNNMPEFFVYDWSMKKNNITGESKLDIDYFKTDFVEATSSIQYFTLNNALTWVDTPGIHSLTKENEELAKKYANYADLILFLVPSSAPAKSDEIKEIKSLLGKGKSLLVAITKSDKNVVYIEDSMKKYKTVPKEDDDREKQEEYVASCIEGVDLSNQIINKNYISVSIKLAEEAIIEKDYEKFKQSNMHEFWNQIGEIVEGDSIELKTTRPKKEINNIISEILYGVIELDKGTFGIKDIKIMVRSLIKELEEQKTKIYNLNEVILSEIKGSIYSNIESKLYNLSREFDMGKEVELIEITELIEKELIDEFNRVIPKQINRIFKGFEYENRNNLKLDISGKFESKTSEIKIPVLEVVTRNRDPKGLEWIPYIFLDKRYTETKVEKDEITKQVKIGNNFVELVNSIIFQLEPQIEKYFKIIIDDSTENYFTPMESMMEVILNEVKTLENSLEKLKF